MAHLARKRRARAQSRVTTGLGGSEADRRRVQRAGISAGGGFDANALAQAILAQQAASAGGGFAPPTFLETQAGQEFLKARELEQIRLQQEFEREQERLRREAEERQRIAGLTQERDIEFTRTYGIDPVRAILLGRGLAPDITGSGRFSELGEMAGIRGRQTEVEQALRKAIGQREGGSARISEQGVEGLPSAQSVARQVQFGGTDLGTLLSSAFGVGNRSLGGGVNPQEFMRLIEDVTPKGVF